MVGEDIQAPMIGSQQKEKRYRVRGVFDLEEIQIRMVEWNRNASELCISIFTDDQMPGTGQVSPHSGHF